MKMTRVIQNQKRINERFEKNNYQEASMSDSKEVRHLDKKDEKELCLAAHERAGEVDRPRRVSHSQLPVKCVISLVILPPRTCCRTAVREAELAMNQWRGAGSKCSHSGDAL